MAKTLLTDQEKCQRRLARKMHATVYDIHEAQRRGRAKRAAADRLDDERRTLIRRAKTPIGRTPSLPRLPWSDHDKP